jgi:hypothetical protein
LFQGELGGHLNLSDCEDRYEEMPEMMPSSFQAKPMKEREVGQKFV